ncbi:permease-like cell division protein FtsX [Crenobacter caeni]|uniref:Cell division protein FtsX n=1 Tax=Crenobacter caeni TaxID=2705474 RepID=A0A6B2KMM6_9NEIS|nr:permease-like cell division protein FtsX [Crenobacter caeni]NDV11486.1 ABC transporter permease [Crenobacter caeni]
MKHYLFLHAQSALLALKRTARAPIASLLNLAMLSLALSLPVALYLVVQGVQQWSGKIDVTPELTVFMEMASEPADIAAVASSLKQHPRVGQSTFVDKQQALAELEARSGVTGMAEGLDGNPLPDAFVVKPATLDAAELDRLQKEIAGLPMVAEVQFDAAWAQKLAGLISLGGQLTLLLGSAFALALVLVTHNTIRMQILARRDEIEISKLIGATDNFIRRPFLYHALWQGVLAALAAWGLSSWLIAAANPVLADFARLYNEQLALRGLTAGELAALTGLSALLAVSGARLATDHHLRQVRAH